MRTSRLEGRRDAQIEAGDDAREASDANAGHGRPAKILAAACRVIARKGVEATRVADIAREAGTSTATVHYHFETKGEVILAALKWANERPYEALEDRLGSATDAPTRLATLLDTAVPYPGEGQDDVLLWVETSITASRLRSRTLGSESENAERRWRAYFVDAVAEGVASGAFEPVAPVEEVAERLIALADGLAFKAAAGVARMPVEHARTLLVRFAAEQVGIPDDELAPSRSRAA